MNITSISADKLFGYLDLRIPISSAGPVTIIHAPNGYGKTTILKLVDALMNKRFDALFHTNFARVALEFTTGTTLSVVRSDAPIQTPGALSRLRNTRAHGFSASPPEGYELIEARLTFSLKGTHEEKNTTQTISRNFLRFKNDTLDLPVSEHDQRLSARERFLLNRARRTQATTADGRVVIVNESPSRYPVSLDEPGVELEPWLESILEVTPVYFIDTDRLKADMASGGDRDKVPQLTVEADALDLADNIRSTYANFSNLSQTLDREFPRKLVLGEEHPTASTHSREEIEAKYKRVIEAGLLEESHSASLPELPVGSQGDGTMFRVLELYYSHQAQKLAVFDELLTKIEPLSTIINEHFHGKSLKIDARRGYRVVSEQGKAIPLTRLSSGEQHQLVLFYRLLFKVEPGGFVMIDEPELSLHAAWQQVFLRDLLTIARARSLRFLVATHSPLIVDNNWDMTVALAQDGPSGETEET